MKKNYYPPPSLKPSHKDHSPKPKNKNVVMWWVHLREICNWVFESAYHLAKDWKFSITKGNATTSIPNYNLSSSNKHYKSQNHTRFGAAHPTVAERMVMTWGISKNMSIPNLGEKSLKPIIKRTQKNLQPKPIDNQPTQVS